MQSDASRTSNNIAVFGSGRSGTTWLAQIIAAAGLELIFEPLKADHVPECRSWKPLPLFYRASDSFPWENVFSKMMAGEIRNEWIIRENAGAARKVIKFIRANLMADWILAHYPVNAVFIVRNPLAVVASMKKEGWGLPARWVGRLLHDPRFTNPYLDALPGVRELGRRDLSDVEARATFWCLQNLIPRELGLWARVPLVIYEEMCRAPEEVVHRIAVELGFPVTPEVLAQCHQPSFMSGRRTGGASYDPTTAWRQHLSHEEAHAIVNVVECFGLQEFLRGV